MQTFIWYTGLQCNITLADVERFARAHQLIRTERTEAQTQHTFRTADTGDIFHIVSSRYSEAPEIIASEQRYRKHLTETA